MRLNSTMTCRNPEGSKVTFHPGDVLPEWAEAMLEGRPNLPVMDEPKAAKPKPETKKPKKADDES